MSDKPNWLHAYARLFARTFSISVTNLLIYRANIFFFLIFETLFFAAQMLSVTIGYDLAGHDIAGWSRHEAYLLTAVSNLSHQIFLCFFVSPIFGLSGQVWSGQFDYILLKPLHPFSSMFFNSQFVIANLPTLVLCSGAVLYLLRGDDGPVVWSQALLFTVLLMLGVGVRIGLALLCVAPVFLSERSPDIEQSFWSVASLGKYQLEIYPWWLRVLFIFIIPLGMMAALPTTVLARPFAWAPLALAGAASLGFLLFSTGIFLLCLRRYQSVNAG